ncbi:hypothetical protein ACFYKX_11230 [Cytobacillus sp. FJAT-54145]|uniref:Uncharacterized protein n=1 Tax=Cytobacillus spartinae TaxID=3299023 RepID=A0ABW6KC61_9BACI
MKITIISALNHLLLRYSWSKQMEIRIHDILAATRSSGEQGYQERMMYHRSVPSPSVRHTMELIHAFVESHREEVA